MATVKKTSGGERREQLRKDFWPTEDPWTGDNEKGWFKAPRTLPLVLSLLSRKGLSGSQDPTRVYLELLARHMDSGVIEMGLEADHAFAAGYEGGRAVRTWRERMRILEKLGFIRVRRAGNQDFRYVLIVHPTTVIERLRASGKISEEWWASYRARQAETKEATYETRTAARKGRKVVRLAPRPAASAASGATA